MKRSEISVGTVYANKKGDRFRLVTDAGHKYRVIGGQTDYDCVQTQTVRKKADGSYVAALGHYDSDGRWALPRAKRHETYGHCTRATMASWAARRATPEEARRVREALGRGTDLPE